MELRADYGRGEYAAFVSLMYNPATNKWRHDEWVVGDEEVLPGPSDIIDPYGPKFKDVAADMTNNMDLQMLEIRLETPPAEPYSVPDAFRRLFPDDALVEEGTRSMGGKDRDPIIEIEHPFGI